MSARQRPPTTGRSNSGDLRNSRSDGPLSSRSKRTSMDRKAGSDVGKSCSPVAVDPPYRLDAGDLDCYKYNPPVLPSSTLEPTIPNYDTGRRSYSRPLTCPTEWVDKLQRPDILDKSSFITDFEEDTKKTMCRSFVDRNRDRLWRLDSSTFQKTPRTVANEILQDPYFVSRMTSVLNKERMYKLSNSEKTAEALTDSCEVRAPYDPFAASLTTSRDARKEKMQTVLAPALLQYGRKHQRGYDHAIDFGNFSKYNGVLKTNEATTMNR